MKSIQTSGKQPLAKITQAQIQVRYIKRGYTVQQKMKFYYIGEQVFLTVSVQASVLPTDTSYQHFLGFHILSPVIHN
jgi:hypothetical protein